MKQYLTTILLVLTLPLGELHTYFDKDVVTVYENGIYKSVVIKNGRQEKAPVYNWIIHAYKPMLNKWNIKFAVSELAIIMYFAAWLFYRPNKVNKTTVKAFFWLAILDAALYFYNYKLGGFGSVYFWFAGFWLVAYKWNYLKHFKWK